MRNGVSARRLTGISSQRSHCGHSTPPVCRRITLDERVKRRRRECHSNRGRKDEGKRGIDPSEMRWGMKDERGTEALICSPHHRSHHRIRYQLRRWRHGQLYVDSCMKASARGSRTDMFTLHSRRVQERPQKPQQGRRKERPLKMR